MKEQNQISWFWSIFGSEEGLANNSENQVHTVYKTLTATFLDVCCKDDTAPVFVLHKFSKVVPILHSF